MNENKIDELLKSQKKEIADDGFTRRVMTNLPRRNSLMPQIIIALFSLASIAVVVAIIGVRPIMDLWESVFTPSGIELTGALVAVYVYIVAAVTTIGLSIKHAAS